jgi:uracil-DNA glycosylase
MRLSTLNKKMSTCTKCPLSASRTNVTTGRGSVNPKIVFVGEAAGEQEDLMGLPFVGAAGANLDRALIESGIEGTISYYITNTTKCRPPQNRQPEPSEVLTCTDAWIYAQIAILAPKLIVPLGKVAASFFIGLPREELRMGEIHGAEFLWKLKPTEQTISVIPIYHPASSLYHPETFHLLVDDLKMIKEWVMKQ